jgi:hypothetical protein
MAKSSLACLNKYGWLSGTSEVRYSYFVDENSFKNESHIIVVIYKHKFDLVFDINANISGGRKVFTIENNASFSLRGSAIEYGSSPLGGIWMHEYLERNIKMAIKSGVYKFTKNWGVHNKIVCEAR